MNEAEAMRHKLDHLTQPFEPGVKPPRPQTADTWLSSLGAGLWFIFWAIVLVRLVALIL